MSALGHKEWRFIVYVVPLFNVSAAHGARTLYVIFWCLFREAGSTPARAKRANGAFKALAYLGILGACMVNVVVMYFTLAASEANYPGGVALRSFNALYENQTQGSVSLSITVAI